MKQSKTVCALFAAVVLLGMSLGAQAQSITIQENTLGFCGVQGTVDSNHSGFTGSGFANADNAIGAGIGWSVNAPASGVYQLEWRFANAASDRPGSVKINGANVTTLGFPSTGAWTSWTAVSTTVSLNAGHNSIRLEATTSAGLANIDSLTVTGGSAVQAADCGGNTNACGDMPGNNVASSCSGNPAVCLLGGGVGNYRVAMKFDTAYNGELEVFAESRRRMFASPQQATSTGRGALSIGSWNCGFESANYQGHRCLDCLDRRCGEQPENIVHRRGFDRRRSVTPTECGERFAI